MSKEDEIQQSIKAFEEEQYNSFLRKIKEIQEVLKPLGYVIDGFREKTSDRFEVHLFCAHSFVCVNELDIDHNEKEET